MKSPVDILADYKTGIVKQYELVLNKKYTGAVDSKYKQKFDKENQQFLKELYVEITKFDRAIEIIKLDEKQD